MKDVAKGDDDQGGDKKGGINQKGGIDFHVQTIEVATLHTQLG